MEFFKFQFKKIFLDLFYEDTVNYNQVVNIKSIQDVKKKKELTLNVTLIFIHNRIVF